MTVSDGRGIAAILEPGYARYDVEEAAFRPFDVGVHPVAADEDAAAILNGRKVVAVLVRERACDLNVFQACPDLRLVVRYGVGTDNVAIEAASERGVYVANVPDYGAEHEVSDQALGLYLAVARRIVTRDAEVRAGTWNVAQSQPVPGRRGATLGLIGFGRIARATCARFRAFGFERVLVSDPALSVTDATASGVEIADVDRICSQADVVSLHAPLMPATRHIIDAPRIAAMKPTAILINVSRGGLVDEAALADALRDGRIFGAGIDVFETEPPAKDNPLLTAPNTVLSDHTGWYSEASVRELQSKAAAEVVRVLQGKPPLNWVNPW